jgi:hypothetical protein
VRLHLEGDRGPVAEVEDARVLAGSLENALAGRRKPLEEARRVLVSAVLRPEQREDRELEVVRFALQQLPDTLRFPVRQTKGSMKRLGGDLRQVIQSNRRRGGISPERATLRSSR